MSELDVGQTFAGKYELVRLIGRGAMGEVWLARHETLGGEFAIKIVKPSDDIEDETAAGRFQLEAQISAKLSRKTRHIVACSDHGEENGFAYIVMELLEGESLESRLKNGDPMDLAEATMIVAQIARGLAMAHGESIFHRDLKPANIFLTRDEEGRILVKLLDFGIARSAKPFRTRSPFATAKDMVLGTPSYMSPEQARGLETLDYRCDLWALAVVAYECLTKKIPWHGDTVEDIFLSICTHQMTPIRNRRPDLPESIDAVFDKAFAKNLDERFASAVELSAAVEAITGAPPLPESNPRIAAAAPISMRMMTPMTEIEPHTNSELKAVSLPETLTGIRQQKSGNGWLWAGLAAAVIILLAGAGFFALRKDVAVAPPPAPPVLVTTKEPTPAPSPTPTETKKADPTPVVTQKPVPGPVAVPNKPIVAEPKPVSAPAVSAKEPPPVVQTPPPVTATPTPPRKPTDKGEIF